MASIYFIQDPQLILVSMMGVGLAWASILAMPYAILTGSLPIRKLGVYMGIFNFFIPPNNRCQHFRFYGTKPVWR